MISIALELNQLPLACVCPLSYQVLRVTTTSPEQVKLIETLEQDAEVYSNLQNLLRNPPISCIQFQPRHLILRLLLLVRLLVLLFMLYTFDLIWKNIGRQTATQIQEQNLLVLCSSSPTSSIATATAQATNYFFNCNRRVCIYIASL